MRYYIGPWQWVTIPGFGDCWDAPAGTKGRIDLRPLPCNIPGQSIFALEAPPKEAGYVELSDSLTKPLSLVAKTALIDGLKLPSLDATNLRDALAEILTTKADTTGADRCLPILPKLDGTLEIWLAGAVVWERPFTGELDPAWPNIQKVLQANYRKVREQALADASAIRSLTLGAAPGIGDADGYRRYIYIQMVVQGGPELLNPDWTPDDWHAEQERQAVYAEGTHRRYLDALHDKYAISADKFIPDDLPNEAPLPHATTITDDFNRANENLEASANWIMLDGSLAVVSNQCEPDATADARAVGQYQTALSTDDHEAQCDIIALVAPGSTRSWGAAMVRVANAPGLYAYDYEATIDSTSTTNRRLTKFINGTNTVLADSAEGLSLPDTFKCSADGSAIKGYINGVEKDSVTDSTITGYLTIGIGGRIQQGSTGDVAMDNFEAADLASGNPWWYYRMIERN